PPKELPSPAGETTPATQPRGRNNPSPPSPPGETYFPVASATGPQHPKNPPGPAGETTPPTQPSGRNILAGGVSHRSPTPKELAKPSGRNNTIHPAQRAKHTCRWRQPPVPNPQRTRQAQRAKQLQPPSPAGETYLPVASATGPH